MLGLIVDSHRRGGYVVAACTRIALKDLARARRLAETIEDPLIRAYALGQMARALASVDKPSAIGLLDEAFDRLEEHRDDRQTYSSPDCVAAVLLEAVEAVDPSRLQESGLARDLAACTSARRTGRWLERAVRCRARHEHRPV